jgi:hypothetical protein
LIVPDSFRLTTSNKPDFLFLGLDEIQLIKALLKGLCYFGEFLGTFVKNRLKNVWFCGIIPHHLLYYGSSP